MATKTKIDFKDTYQKVTDAVIEQLEKGCVIWKCPWNNYHIYGYPKNITTMRNYRGFNVFWLYFNKVINNYSTPYYLTYIQAKQLGGSIKKGEYGTLITYWAEIKLNNHNSDNPEEVNSEMNNDKPRSKFVPRYYVVFNIAQTEGIDFSYLYENKETYPVTEKTKLENCEDIIENMPDKPILLFEGDTAFYDRKKDIVSVPDAKEFEKIEGFYSTIFHELGHSTGHEKRLNRKELVTSNRLNDKDNYAKEELVAELTASFLCGISGIVQETIEQNSAYINTWIERLKNDKTLILKAAAQAQKACDFILNVKPDANQV